MAYTIDIPVLCFGGLAELREELRPLRANLFFERNEIVDRRPVFLKQFRWSGPDLCRASSKVAGAPPERLRRIGDL
jgi:hypothetical protein